MTPSTRLGVRLILAGVMLSAAGAALYAQLVQREMKGVRNLTIVSPTVACAGATDTSAIPVIAAEGYKAIVNLRLANEDGADINQARAAAAAAGIRFIHLPFDVNRPDEAVVDRFFAAVTDEANLPVFIHCASANRVAGLWLIKRVVVDGWDLPKAESEARTIGLSNPRLRDFALAQIKKRKG